MIKIIHLTMRVYIGLVFSSMILGGLTLAVIGNLIREPICITTGVFMVMGSAFGLVTVVK